LIRFIIYITLLVFFALKGYSQGLVSNNPKFKADVLKTINLIYNNNFEEADKEILLIKEKYPKLPIYNLFNAIRINWTMLPQKTDDSLSPIIFKELEATIKKCDAFLKTKKDEEILFCKFIAHSLYAMHYANNKEYLSSTEHARHAYSILKSGFQLAENNHDFYLTSGLYNFYIDQYPKAYPIFKPFTVFFASGNSEDGIKFLKKASEEGLFAKTEAKMYLAHIHLKYINNAKESFKWSEKLVTEYPNNLFFLSNYIESAIVLKKYDIINLKIQKLLQSTNKNYRISGNLYNAIYQEKVNFNYLIAKKSYLNIIEQYLKNKNAPAHHKSLAYLGLSRIATQENNEKLAKEYLNKSIKYAEYKYVKDEIFQIANKLMDE
jgi:hypothetical protein